MIVWSFCVHSLDIEELSRKYNRPVYLTSSEFRIGFDELLECVMQELMETYGVEENGVPLPEQQRGRRTHVPVQYLHPFRIPPRWFYYLFAAVIESRIVWLNFAGRLQYRNQTEDAVHFDMTRRFLAHEFTLFLAYLLIFLSSILFVSVWFDHNTLLLYIDAYGWQ
jgi:hypothetical protein